ncbi:MAG: PIN domain-containing protein [Polyangiales bacterium]
MKIDGVLVDSSVWIDVLRHPHDSDSARMHSMISQGLALTTGVIQAEILPFVRQGHREDTERLFAALPMVTVQPEERFWSRVVHWRKQLVGRGLGGIALPNVMIATVALEHRTPLWSRDRHFDRIAQHCPLLRWKPEQGIG